MSRIFSELSGSLTFRSGSTVQAALIPSANALGLTGSLNITGSSLTFNGTDVIQRIATLEAGSVGVSLVELNQASASLQAYTASNDISSASFDNRIDTLESTTTEHTSDITTLQAATSSYITGTGTLTSAGFLSSSNSAVISSSTQIADLGYITNASVTVPAGTVSSSQQILDLEFLQSDSSNIVSSSTQITDLGFITSIPANVISASGQISDLGFITAAGVTHPAGIVSSSGQISALGFITSSVSGSHTDITALNTYTASNNIASASFDSRLDVVELVSSSAHIQRLAISASQALVTTSYDEITGKPAGIISASGQIAAFGFVTSSGAAGSHTNITALNTYTASNDIASASFDSRIDEKATKLTNTFVGQQIVSGSIIPGAINNDLGSSVKPWQHIYVSSGSIKFINPDGTEQSNFNNQFDGNRVVSNTEHPLFNSYNPGTTNTLGDFLEAVFYPNTAPTISTGNQVIAEYEPIGTNLATLAGADAEAQAITFTIDSSYTDGYVNITGGVLKLAVLPTVAAFNTTNRGDGELAHPVIVRATDTIGAFTLKTIYVTVTANAAPQFRETSVGGNVISSFTTSRNENASAGEITKIYFTDTETDTITITSGSDSGDLFSITKSPTYVTINQVTGSLDYETNTVHILSITASDQHFSDGDDSNSFVQIPITINVTDNTQPTVNNQTITGLSENSANNAAAGTITATDPEGDTIVFKTATLSSIDLDGSDISLGTYTGTSVSDPTEDAFDISSTGVVTRKSSVFLNSDIVNNYKYQVTVTDAYNNGTDTGIITIPISDDGAPTISGETTLYIIESATNGSSVYDNSNGYSGTTSQFTANQSVTWAVTPSSKLAINSSGYITVNYDVSGSSDVGGTQINGTVTATNAFNTPSTQNFTLNVTDNTAPTITFTDVAANLNTNKATSPNNLTTISFSDSEGDGVDLSSFVFNNNGNALTSTASGDNFIIRPSAPLAAGTYNFTTTIKDTHAFATRTSTHSITIAQAGTGTLTNNGTYYIIESAVNGALVRTNSNGRTGTQGDLGVNYSPNYGAQSVGSFASSNSAVVVASNGNLSIGLDISATTSGSGDTIVSNITYTDQYSNSGTTAITVNVAANSSPVPTISPIGSLETDNVASGSTAATVAISDTEADYPITIALSGTHASSFIAVANNSDGTSFNINAASALAAGTYSFTITATDAFGKTGAASSNVTIAQSADYGKVYIYTSTYGSDAGFGANYNAVMGATSVNSDTPPEVTGYSGNTESPYYKFKTGDVGSTSITLAGSTTATLRATVSGSNLDTVLQSAGTVSAVTTGQTIILFPSGSDMTVPNSIQESFNSVANGAVPCMDVDGNGFGIESGELHSLTLDTAHLGYSEWFIFGRKSRNSSASGFKIRLVAANGSLPT